MQEANLSQVSLRFFDVMPYGTQLVPDCNLARMIQRGFKALDAKRSTSGEGISLLYVIAGEHGSILKSAGASRCAGRQSFCFAPSMSARLRHIADVTCDLSWAAENNSQRSLKGPWARAESF